MSNWSIDLSFFHAPEVQYLLLVCGLFIVPRFLQRFRIPSAITCAAIGAIAGIGFDAFQHDSTIYLLSLLGIVSMFLFAGLEVDVTELREGSRVIAVHLVIQLVLLALVAVSVRDLFRVNARTSILYALALVTPSTGFILDSLHSFGLVGDQGFWVKSKSIATELLALLVLFVTIQSQSLLRLLTSGLVLIAMVALLPKFFRVFAKRILPFAPNSEFAFLVVAALICAAITRRLGVYYLVGAFLVGIIARRFRQELPEVSSIELVRSLELFASFFIPFYFFKAGLHLSLEYFSLKSVGLGLLFFAVIVPIRVLSVTLHRTHVFGRPMTLTRRVAIAMTPTLVFTLVIANILQEQFGLPPALYGALIVYALATTVVPGIALGAAPVYDRVPSIPPPPSSGVAGT